MFKSARIKLTAWYLVIIMLITFVFSGLIYAGVANVTSRALDNQQRRLEHRFRDISPNQKLPSGFQFMDPETLTEIRSRTLSDLVTLNVSLFVVPGSLGYFLAGGSLHPIEHMVQQQKRFVSDAAHELRPPITAIKTNIEVTLRSQSLSLADAGNVLTDTVEEIDKLTAFTNKLLARSKYQASVVEEKEPIQLDELLRDIARRLQSIAAVREQNIELVDKPLKVLGNRSSLEEVFTNILENSLKYSSEKKSIAINMSNIGNNVIVAISDQGIGIKKEELPHIFEPFYRADKSRTGSGSEGYGLGLAIAKDIVEAHKGSISAKSVINEGTTFTITLPSL